MDDNDGSRFQSGNGFLYDFLASIRTFVLCVLDAVAAHVPCVKFQSACFERYGHLGVHTLVELMAAAREHGLEVILDAKRGDIGVSAEHYAAAAFGADDAAPARAPPERDHPARGLRLRPAGRALRPGC